MTASELRALVSLSSRRKALPRQPAAPPDWVAARPSRIAGVAARAAARPTGGWVVAGATPRRGDPPRRVEVEGRTLVLWASPEGPIMGPDVCPHMGAELSEGRVDSGCLVCPWHDLRLGPEGHAWWKPLPVHDDGVLTWVGLPTDARTDAPLVPKRPDGAVTAVVERSGRCDVRDIIENRLDPWHGRHLHPYAFSDLVVVEEDDSGVTCEVDYRMFGPVAARVLVRFEAPEAATVRMEILEGLGAGSVVETHATRAAPGRVRVIEALFATAPGASVSGRWFAPIIAAVISRVADRLWVDDVAYAERRYALRQGEVADWRGSTGSPGP